MQGIRLGREVPGGVCDFCVGYPDGMFIRPATTTDVDFIESAFDHAREFMRAHGNPTQWPSDYPSRSDALSDIERGECFLVCDEQGPLAVFSFARGPEEEYSQIDGAWHFDDEYGVIHRLASVRGRGVTRVVMDFCAGQVPYLRCDTHLDNGPMRRALEAYGFEPCGMISVRGQCPRIAYDGLFSQISK